MKSVFSVLVVLVLCTSFVAAQRTEITISLNEQFFDALLDGMYQNSSPIEFSIASVGAADARQKSSEVSTFAPSGKTACKQVIQLLRENNGVRTAVRFRDGKIYAPIAFSGNYSPPFVGCVAFSGYAETNIELVFDQDRQRLIARAKAVNVSLNGTGGVGSSVIAKLVQSSIDKKVNPIEVIRLDKLSFAIPVQNSGKLSMKAVGIRTGIENGVLNVHVSYEFVK